jgi:hypothetical protein
VSGLSWKFYQEIPRFIGTPRFITVFTRPPPPNPILSHMNQVYTPIFGILRSNLIIYTHLLLGFPSYVIPRLFRLKSLRISHIFLACYMPRPSHPSRCPHMDNIYYATRQCVIFSVHVFHPLSFTYSSVYS